MQIKLQNIAIVLYCTTKRMEFIFAIMLTTKNLDSFYYEFPKILMQLSKYVRKYYCLFLHASYTCPLLYVVYS